MAWLIKLNVNVVRTRAEPNLKSPLIGTIRRVDDKYVTASKNQGDWYYVDAFGWAERKYIASTKKYLFTATPLSNDSLDEYRKNVKETNALGGMVLTLDPIPKNGQMGTDHKHTYSEETDNDILDLLEEGMRFGSDSSDDMQTYGGYGSMSSSPIMTYGGFINKQTDWVDYAGQAKTTYLSDSMRENIRRIKHNMSIPSPYDKGNLFTQFNRWKVPILDNVLAKSVPYVFFTRPMMPISQVVGSTGIVGNVSGYTPGEITLAYPYNVDPVMSGINSSNKWIMRMLVDNGIAEHKFNPYLSNGARSFEIQDEVIKTIKHGRTYSGWEMVYGRNTNESNTSGQFNIQYMDDPNANLLKIHKLWLYMINAYNRGMYKPDRQDIYEKVMNYTCAVYFFELHTDGETILYWSKYYGVFPMNVPGNSHGFTWGSPTSMQEFSVSYVYSMRKEMDALNLAEFNSLSSGRLLYRKTYDPKVSTATPTMVNAPFVEQSRIRGNTVYKLRWRN